MLTIHMYLTYRRFVSMIKLLKRERLFWINSISCVLVFSLMLFFYIDGLVGIEMKSTNFFELITILAFYFWIGILLFLLDFLVGKHEKNFSHYWFKEFSGYLFLKDKFKSKSNSNKQTYQIPISFYLFPAYFAFFTITNQMYESKIKDLVFKVEIVKRSTFSRGRIESSVSLGEIPALQMAAVPSKPRFLNPKTLIWSFLFEDQIHLPMVKDLMNTVRNNRGDLGPSMYQLQEGRLISFDGFVGSYIHLEPKITLPENRKYIDWTGSGFYNISLKRSVFASVDFSKSDFRNVDFFESDLSNSILLDVKFRGINFSRCDLSNVVFSIRSQDNIGFREPGISVIKDANVFGVVFQGREHFICESLIDGAVYLSSGDFDVWKKHGFKKNNGKPTGKNGEYLPPGGQFSCNMHPNLFP